LRGDVFAGFATPSPGATHSGVSQRIARGLRHAGVRTPNISVGRYRSSVGLPNRAAAAKKSPNTCPKEKVEKLSRMSRDINRDIKTGHQDSRFFLTLLPKQL
jgi:hypothetical protein